MLSYRDSFKGWYFSESNSRTVRTVHSTAAVLQLTIVKSWLENKKGRTVITPG